MSPSRLMCYTALGREPAVLLISRLHELSGLSRPGGSGCVFESLLLCLALQGSPLTTGL